MNRTAKYLSLAAFIAVVGFAASASATDQIVTPNAVGCLEGGAGQPAAECYVNLTTTLTGTGCPNSSQIRFAATAGGAESMYRAALSAFLSGKKILVNPSGSCTASNFPRVLYLQIQN